MSNLRIGLGLQVHLEPFCCSGLLDLLVELRMPEEPHVLRD